MDRPLVYFLCVGNAMRSQMAEGFLRHRFGDRFDVASAGTHPYGQVIPEVIEVMREKGIDISRHTSDPIDPDIVERCIHVIDLGGRGRDRIPTALGHKYVAWTIQDPYQLGYAALCDIRDQIEAQVERYVREWQPPRLDAPSA